MIQQSTDVALLVHSCDRYEFLYPGFEHFFSKQWDFEIPCNYYFATEEKNVSIKHFKNILSGKGEWADRLGLLLKERIAEKYILYFQEDMWLNKKVDKDFFISLFKMAEENDWKQVKLHSSEVYNTSPTAINIRGLNIAIINNSASDFLMSHQVTLWDKQFLLNQLKEGEHPWRNERRGTKRLRKLDPPIYQVDYFAENGKPAINNNESEFVRSEYQTISANGLLGHNIQPFIAELLVGNVEDRTYGHALEHHYKNNLTHDGLPRPKKEDIFKKVKNWFKKGS